MAPLSYYWIIAFNYLVMAKKNYPCPGIEGTFFLCLTDPILFQEIFPFGILIRFYLSGISLIDAKKKICIYVSIRYYES